MVSPSFSTGISRVVILVSLSLRFRISGVTQVVDLLLCPFFQGLLELREVVLRLLQDRLVYLELFTHFVQEKPSLVTGNWSQGEQLLRSKRAG